MDDQRLTLLLHQQSYGNLTFLYHCSNDIEFSMIDVQILIYVNSNEAT